MKRHLLKGMETFHLEIAADENNLSGVRDFIAEICLKAGFSKRETNNTKLAMDEACTNIIKHAYRDKAGTIRIDVQAEPGKVEISIFDRGIPFEWSDVKDPDLQRYVEIGKKGGLGIFLMNRLMDDLSYEASENGNRLFMMKTAGSERAEPLFASRTSYPSFFNRFDSRDRLTFSSSTTRMRISSVDSFIAHATGRLEEYLIEAW